jgi:hypothetical protein
MIFAALARSISRSTRSYQEPGLSAADDNGVHRIDHGCSPTGPAINGWRRKGVDLPIVVTATTSAVPVFDGNDLAEATDPQRSPLLGALQAPFFTDDDRLRALFLATFSRQPADEELSLCRQQVAKYAESDRSKAYGDVLWVLLNSAEFALNH